MLPTHTDASPDARRDVPGERSEAGAERSPGPGRGETRARSPSQCALAHSYLEAPIRPLRLAVLSLVGFTLCSCATGSRVREEGSAEARPLAATADAGSSRVDGAKDLRWWRNEGRPGPRR